MRAIGKNEPFLLSAQTGRVNNLDIFTNVVTSYGEGEAIIFLCSPPPQRRSCRSSARGTKHAAAAGRGGSRAARRGNYNYNVRRAVKRNTIIVSERRAGHERVGKTVGSDRSPESVRPHSSSGTIVRVDGARYELDRGAAGLRRARRRRRPALRGSVSRVITLCAPNDIVIF